MSVQLTLHMKNMLWCEHCGGRIPTRLDDNCFISCSNCGKILLCQDASTGEPTFVKRPGRMRRRASSFIKSISSDYSQPFKKNLNEGNPTAAETSQEASHQMLFKKHASVSNYKNPKELNHDGDATGQNPGTIEHESDIMNNDFKLRHLGYENVKVGSDINGGTASYNKLYYGKQDDVCDYSYDGDDDYY